MVENEPPLSHGRLAIETAKHWWRPKVTGGRSLVQPCKETNNHKEMDRSHAYLDRLYHLGVDEMIRRRGDYWQSRLRTQSSHQYVKRPWRILVSRKPLSAALTLAHAQLGLVLMMLIFIFLHPHDSLLVQVRSLIAQETFSHFRVSTVHNKSSLSEIEGWGVMSQGHLFPTPEDGAEVCRAESRIQIHRISPDGDASYITMRHATVTDGIYFLLTDGGGPARLADLKIEGSSDGHHWKDLRRSGACGRAVMRGLGREDQDRSGSLTCGKGRRQLIELHLSGVECKWMEYMDACRSLVAVICIVLALVLSRTEKYEGAVKAMGLGSLLWSMTYLGLFWRYEWGHYSTAEALYALQALGVMVIFPGPAVISEAVAFEQMLVCALYMIACSLALTARISVSAILALTFMVLLLVLREGTKRRSRRVAMEGVEEYASIFDESKEQILPYLDSLSRTISELNLESQRRTYRHHTSTRQAEEGFAYGLGSERFTRYMAAQSRDSRVKSLDQLFLQAIVVHDQFLSKVKAICSGLDGVSLDLAPDGTLLKDFEGCVEKAVVAYDGDVSRLVDVVSTRLVCRDLRDVRSCIEVIAKDPDLQVIRVKNRFDRHYDARQTGGYRDVCLNVCLVTDETWRVGVSGHVCELQLALESFLGAWKEDEDESYVLYDQVCELLGDGDGSTYQRVSGMALQDKQWGNEEPCGHTEKTVNAASCDMAAEENRVRALMRQKCCFPGDLLERYLADVCHGVERADISSVMFGTAPIKLGSQKLALQLFLVLQAAVQIWRIFKPSGVMDTICTEMSFTSRHLRFTTLMARDGKSPRGPGIASVGLLHNGYELNCSKTRLWGYNNSLYASFEEAVVANGWFFRTSVENGTEESDPALFVFSFSSVPSDAPWTLPSRAWEVYGGPECHWKMYSARCHPLARREYKTSRLRNHVHAFDHRPPWFQTMHIQYGFLVSFHYTMTAVMGWMRRPIAAKFFWVNLYFVLGSMVFCKAVMHVLCTTIESSFYWWIVGSSLFGLGLTSWFKERYVMHYLLFHACLSSVAINVYSWLYLGIGFRAPSSAPVLIFTFVAWLLYNRIVLYRAWQHVAEDCRHYDDLTTKLLRDPDSQRCIEKISTLTECLGVGRQLSQYQAVSRFRRGSRFGYSSAGFVVRSQTAVGVLMRLLDGVKGMLGWTEAARSRQIQCFDQLYMQAFLLDPLFLDKVKSLAERAGGFCLVEDETSEARCKPMRWRDCKLDEALRGKARFAKLKSIDRCVEKLSRAYAGDVSRLVDIVRQSIMFEDLKELHACLEMIAEDPDLQVIRVKNRFDRRYDARQTGGYRDVCLNVCLVTDETWRVGVSGHVCELQLALCDYKMRATSGKGHSRYVSYRNLRCE
ncbi:hypothetical protein GUITHDRAFT_99165 [Guillardia theta CCMP2712]|uniref:Uncharacterized protein n=2 Tax=Guillardia theta TaxID=55529 RepID=L1K481_GUITC|nr:hypothetical protein GUITHDRAFT_99165 [Guillardia theta CCMP2712]EKX55382.1 hypothetical protein GUITHDRAFT_99165 [Guillardia theta CCMP2712]|eukprot:XP_005842362.1 hypothetical protein GUITHDRAFT_99165 [Guillardia theta CCMP2712]